MSDTATESTRKVLEGTLSHAKLTRDTGNWNTFEVMFGDGQAHTVIVKKEDNFDLRKRIGEPVSFYDNGSIWILERKWTTGNPERGGGERKKHTANSDSPNVVVKRDTYAEKLDYEVDTKDPKIEFRSLFSTVAQTYNASIPSFANPPTSPKEVDEVLDEAFGKAQELYLRINKKKEEDEG